MAPAIKRPAPRAAKLDALVHILRDRKAPITAAALAESLKVSERTVYRYVSELVAQGLQIQGGAGFGYVFWPAVASWSVSLTEKEAQAVLLGLKLAETRSRGSFGETVRLTLAKVQDVVSAPTRDLFWSPAAPTDEDDPTPVARVDLEPYLTAIQSSSRMIVEARLPASGFEGAVCPIALHIASAGIELLGWVERDNEFVRLPISDFTRAEILDKSPHYSRARLLQVWERSRNSSD